MADQAVELRALGLDREEAVLDIALRALRRLVDVGAGIAGEGGRDATGRAVEGG